MGGKRKEGVLALLAYVSAKPAVVWDTEHAACTNISPVSSQYTHICVRYCRLIYRTNLTFFFVVHTYLHRHSCSLDFSYKWPGGGLGGRTRSLGRRVDYGVAYVVCVYIHFSSHMSGLAAQILGSGTEAVIQC